MSSRDDHAVAHARSRAHDRPAHNGRPDGSAPDAHRDSMFATVLVREDDRNSAEPGLYSCAGLRSSYSDCSDRYAHGVPPSLGGNYTLPGQGAGVRVEAGGCTGGVDYPCGGAGSCGGCAPPSLCGGDGCGDYYKPFPVALGYAAYVSPTVAPSNFETAFLGSWRVAVPRSCDRSVTVNILERINASGPRYAGYTRFGDVLVPSSLNATDRRRVALSLQ